MSSSVIGGSLKAEPLWPPTEFDRILIVIRLSENNPRVQTSKGQHIFDPGASSEEFQAESRGAVAASLPLLCRDAGAPHSSPLWWRSPAPPRSPWRWRRVAWLPVNGHNFPPSLLLGGYPSISPR